MTATTATTPATVAVREIVARLVAMRTRHVTLDATPSAKIADRKASLQELNGALDIAAHVLNVLTDADLTPFGLRMKLIDAAVAVGVPIITWSSTKDEREAYSAKRDQLIDQLVTDLLA